MKVWHVLLWALVALVASIADVARADGEPPDLDHLLDRHFQARGGLAAIRALDAYRAVGTFEMGGARASYTMLAKRPGKLRMEFVLQGVAGIQAIQGDAGWQVMPFSGITRPTPMSAEEARNFQDQADLDGPLVDWQAKGHRVRMLGGDEVDGDAAWRLGVQLASGAEVTVWIDATTFIDRRWDVRTTLAGQPMKISIHFGDHREVGGLVMPHRIEQQIHGLPAAQLFTVDEYALNVDIDDTVFRLPPETASRGEGDQPPGN